MSDAKFPAPVVRVQIYGRPAYVMKAELEDENVSALRLMLKSGWPKNCYDRANRDQISEVTA